MDFEFSDDQQQLRDAVARWVERAYGIERHHAISRAGGYSAEAWGELAELGLCGLYVPEDFGGLGMGPVEGMVVLEELGRGIVLEPLAQALICGAVLAAYAPDAIKRNWLPRLASGEALVVLAHQERGARYRLDRCDTQAQQQGEGWTLTGAKSIVSAGAHAQAFLVPATTPQGMALFLADATASGVSTRGYGTLDGACAAELRLDAAAAHIVTPNGLDALRHAVDIGIASACAEAVGAMDKVLAVTAEYLNTRKQFGVPIASFQALRHRAADMKMQLELARSMSYYATLKLNAPAEERRSAMARAKVQIGQSMRFVGQQAIQLHGGIGMTDEYIVGHYFRRLTQLELSFGDTLHHLGEVSARMQDQAGVFA